MGAARSWAGPPLQTVAGGCRTESSGCQGNIQRPQGPRRLSRKGTRPPEPLGTAFPPRCSHSCSAEGSWEVGAGESEGKASSPGFQGGAASVLCIWGILPKAGKLRLWERQGLFSFSASREIPLLLWLQSLLWLLSTFRINPHTSRSMCPSRPCSAPATSHQGSAPAHGSLSTSASKLF